jgi:hypothetical protein
MIRRIALGSLVGSLITAIAWLVDRLDHELLSAINLLVMPGIFVAMVVSGNVHNILGGLPFIHGANVLCYALVIFFWLRPKEKPSPN